MKTRRSECIVLALLLAFTAQGGEPSSPPPPPPESGVTAIQTAHGKAVEVVLPGRLLDTSLPNLPLLLLVANDSPEGTGPRTLLKFDAADEGHLEVLATDLPKTIETVHLLTGPIESHAVLLGAPEVIYRLNAQESILEPLLTGRHLDLAASKHLSAGSELLVPRVGLLERWSWTEAGTLTRQQTVELPVRVDRQRGGLRLFTPPLNPLRGSEPPQIILGPVAQGKQRLHSIRLDQDAASDTQDSWALLPTPEAVEDHWYVSLDGVPALVVTTTNAEKLGIFEKKTLRVFPLHDDRTRAGRPPRLAVDTVTRRWFSPDITVLDWDGDGRDDLVVIEPDGLGGKKLVLNMYLGKGKGLFLTLPRKTTLTAPQATWHYGADLDGDHRPDLVTADEHGLRIFPGVAANSKRLVVEKEPRATWTPQQLAASPDVRRILAARTKQDNELQLRRPQSVDLDGDGRDEILTQASLAGRTVLWWVNPQTP